MAHAIRIRADHPEFGGGDWEALPTGHPSVIALSFHLQERDAVAVHNLGQQERRVRFRAWAKPRVVFSSRPGDDSAALDLEPYGYRWFTDG
jgi:hypothetical protein